MSKKNKNALRNLYIKRIKFSQKNLPRSTVTISQVKNILNKAGLPVRQSIRTLNKTFKTLGFTGGKRKSRRMTRRRR